jgi:3-deoxy-D-manno-octulosonate 8-phosphate phosphatase (KDO 8-P phosphatase)
LDNLQERLAAIELVIFDCDGVLTDGSVIVDSEGKESLQFCVQDGYGIFRGYNVGLEYAIITGRTSRVVEYRAADLRIERVYLGQTVKKQAFEEILAESGLAADSVAYVGDDLNDLPVMERVGVSCAVANARDEVKEGADVVTGASGGYGAVREFLEMIIAAKGGVPSS